MFVDLRARTILSRLLFRCLQRIVAKRCGPWHLAVVSLHLFEIAERCRRDSRFSELYLRKDSFTLGSHLRHVSGENDVRIGRRRCIDATCSSLHSSTYLGEPIPYDPDATPEVLAGRVSGLCFVSNLDTLLVIFRLQVKKEIEKLIETYQRRPGSITRAFLDRFPRFSTHPIESKSE